MSENDALMDELRGLFTLKPGKRTWLKLCATLDRWPADALARRDGEALPYCQEHLLTWSARIQTRPPDAWIKRWFEGDPTVVELMGLGYLNSARAPGSKRPPRERCTYYTIWAGGINWDSHEQESGERYESWTWTPERSAVEKAVEESAAQLEVGFSALWQRLDPSDRIVDACHDARVTLVLNGVEVGLNLLLPDFTFNIDRPVRLVMDRPMALYAFLRWLPSDWLSCLSTSPASLLDEAGELLWRGPLDKVKRTEPWVRQFDTWLYFDDGMVETDTAPLLAELPHLPAFNRLPDVEGRVETLRFGD